MLAKGSKVKYTHDTNIFGIVTMHIPERVIIRYIAIPHYLSHSVIEYYDENYCEFAKDWVEI